MRIWFSNYGITERKIIESALRAGLFENELSKLLIIFSISSFCSGIFAIYNNKDNCLLVLVSALIGDARDTDNFPTPFVRVNQDGGGSISKDVYQVDRSGNTMNIYHNSREG